MSEDFIEIYAKEKKELTSLVQEWINENREAIIYKIKNIELKNNQIDR